MHPFILAYLTGSAITAAAQGFQFPDSVIMLERRQTTGAKYECHANCGYTIQDSSSPTHCTNATWTSYLSGCLDCALKFDIWNDYGEGVVAAAATCNLTAVPIAVTNLTTSASGSGTITATVSVTSSHDMAGITNTAASGSLTTAGPGGTAVSATASPSTTAVSDARKRRHSFGLLAMLGAFFAVFAGLI